ncbi:MAG: hypothetical protein HY827_03710 [Actinobacteria bacterium]|nr:hypothetical protein [Actinomycetota bacterium]
MALTAGTAQAAAVSVESGVMTYVTDSGADNEIVISDYGSEYLITDSESAATTDDPNCWADFGGVLCDAASVDSFYVDSADGNDSIAMANSYLTKPVVFNGGGGNDNITGSAGNDTLNGGAGDDLLSGRDGNNSLNGNDDNDTLRGGNNADDLNGGTGFDTVDYSWRTANLNLNAADNLPYDGADGEGDNIRYSSEVIKAGSGNDVVIVSPSAVLGQTYGNGGNDTIYGSNNSWDEYIYGGAGTDTIYGNNGSDRIDGGSGADTIYGGTHSDTILIRDSENDVVDCGAGSETVTADLLPLDSNLTGCETVNRG